MQPPLLVNLEYKQALSVYKKCISNVTNENQLTNKCGMGQTLHSYIGPGSLMEEPGL